MARYVSMNFPSTATPQEIIEELTKRIDERKFLGKDSFPNELAYKDGSRSIGAYALTAKLVPAPI